MMGNTDLHGVIVPMITPVDDEDRVDEVAFRRVIRRLVGSGVHTLFVGGSAGEGPLLAPREWHRMVEIAFDEVNGALPLLGGVMDTSTQRVKEKISALAKIGFKYFVLTPSYYYTLQAPGEHLRLFSECAESSQGMDMIVYNIPSAVNSQIPIEVVVELARRGVAKYCKESSADFAYFERLMAEAAPFGLKVFMGEEPNIAAGLLGGASGIVPVSANLEPKTFVQAYEAGLRQDREELARLQARINLVRSHLPRLAPCWIAGVKHSVAALGLCSGKPVSPLQPLTAAERQKLDAFVRASASYQ
jgi:4-hydroxy-tetrahydrodipicolinate synthase